MHSATAWRPKPIAMRVRSTTNRARIVQEMDHKRAWYREPWPWIIIGLLGSVIVASLITLWIAVTHPDPLVVDEAEFRQIHGEMHAQEALSDTQAAPETGAGRD